MLKKTIGLGLFLLLAQNAFAQGMSVQNAAGTAKCNTAGASCPISVDTSGRTIIGSIVPGTGPTNEGKAEDAAHASGDTGIQILGITRDITAVSQSLDGDYAPPAFDRTGRTITTYAPSAEFYSGCSASNTGTSDTQILAAVASNRIYITSISCFNTTAVASSISFKSGATQTYAGGISNSTLTGVGVYTASLPVPLRLGVNTAFNFAMGTTATATTCCASSYLSVN